MRRLLYCTVLLRGVLRARFRQAYLGLGLGLVSVFGSGSVARGAPGTLFMHALLQPDVDP
jgi:hypothetical protein